MYRVAFKYNPRIITDNKAYPWQIPQDKYALDRKILKEEAFATVDRKRMSQWLLMDPKTHMRIDSKTFGKPNGVEMMQLNRNASLYGAVPMNRGQHTHVAGMLPMPQQGGNQSGNHSLSDQSSGSSYGSYTSSSSGGGGPSRGGGGRGGIGRSVHFSIGSEHTINTHSSGDGNVSFRTQRTGNSQVSQGAQLGSRNGSLSSNGSVRSVGSNDTQSIYNAIFPAPNYFPSNAVRPPTQLGRVQTPVRTWSPSQYPFLIKIPDPNQGEIL